ncbi:SusF/SusE family outer membrane protein [Ancylomarina longa]|uniref:SusF/SusE family outer membrane protein n=1 Tax=Ancylomarina longa TaxID=2487017 RepID=A0A434AX58_9BACT|nr:SusF/SusE family outer membrane protein [Ancylomarina longa]RUT79016.1 SusF/SusE family outer membrane protein [Ancylomarina longa]
MKKRYITQGFIPNWKIDKGGIFITVLISILFSFLLPSCDNNEEIVIEMGNPVQLSASKSEVELNQKNANLTAIEYTWTPGSNEGTGAAISYILQLDIEGNNFSTPKTFEVGKAVLSKKYTTEELNNILLNDWGATAGTTVMMESRVIAITSSDVVVPDTSKIVAVSVMSYVPVSNTLYMVGDATPNGWDNSIATPLQENPDEPATFTYEGTLKAGELKFITQLGEWLPSYQKGEDVQHIVLRTDDSQPDEKFSIAESGVYRITLNLLDLNISFEKLDQSPYDELWIVGDATPNGWNIDNPNKMVQDPTDSFIFTYNEYLNAGEFKFPTSTGDWGTDFYMPLTNYPDLSETTVQLVSGGDPDYKWKITDAGPYKIQLNLRDLSISIKAFEPYTMLWMVGDATPAGWDIDNPTEMVPDSNDPNVFTYTGPLTAGEFKFPTSTGDWGADFFMPVENHPELSDTRMKFISGGSPDSKWEITSAGNYTITINQFYETISIVKN